MKKDRAGAQGPASVPSSPCASIRNCRRN